MSKRSNKIRLIPLTPIGSAGFLIFSGISVSALVALAPAPVFGSVVSATSASGSVRLNAEVATAIAMKIASPNDTNPDCTSSVGVTYGTANRYATSNGAEGSKQVDTFDGTTGGADEVNSNTSCTTLSMEPNTYSSTYSDVTVYTNSPNGYALSVRSADNVSPNLVNIVDNTLSIPAGTLTEVDGTGSQSGTRVVPGAQNLWSIKGDSNSNLDTWTAVTAEDQTVRAYDMETSGGSTTRVTYGISSGDNPAGKYATTLTYTATMFDGLNPYFPSTVSIPAVDNLTVSTSTLSVPYGDFATITVTPAKGYYLSNVSCPTGFTCTGYNTGTNWVGTQTITVANNNTNKTGTLDFSVTALGVADLNSATYMQDFGPETCKNTPSGASKVLTDSRDSSQYRVTKLADNNCWMTQDLKFGGSTAMALTGDTVSAAGELTQKGNSDLENNKTYTLPTENTGTWCTEQTAACYNQSLMLKTGVPNGYLYNWYAATAGTGVYGTSAGVNATASICPKGWKLPTGGSGGNFANLDIAYGGSGSNRTDADQRNKFMAAPLNFNYTGYRDGGSVNYPSDFAGYWSSTAYSEVGAYRLGFYSGGYFSPQGGSNKYVGFAVRCVAAS